MSPVVIFMILKFSQLNYMINRHIHVFLSWGLVHVKQKERKFLLLQNICIEESDHIFSEQKFKGTETKSITYEDSSFFPDTF